MKIIDVASLCIKGKYDCLRSKFREKVEIKELYHHIIKGGGVAKVLNTIFLCSTYAKCDAQKYFL